MKILHVVRQYEPSIGGLEAYVKSMAQQQMKMGHVVEVLTLNKVFGDTGKQILPAYENTSTVSVKRIGFIGKRQFFLPFLPFKYLKAFDIIHVHSTDGFFDSLGLLSKFLKPRLVATTHGSFFHTKELLRFKKFYLKFISRFTCMGYKVLFANTENDAALFQDKHKNIVIQPNAVEPLGDFIADGLDMLYLGRLAPHKNAPKLVELVHVLKRDYDYKGTLHIVGPEWGVKKADLTAQAQQLGISKQVKVHGFVKDETLKIMLKECGWFVSASEYEGFGMSLIEGMSVGLLPIVHPNDSFKILIKQAGMGHLLDYHKIADHIESIGTSINTIDAADRQKAIAFSKQFAWDDLAEKSIVYYEQALARNV